ncbi:hypothetical protein DVH24_002076 [Malus domestica]|uniref:Uncharacterized protein n=1 Tax=Malus domestica TaxID=3750 RepID=A0A498I487_MALDO|nr:hypothetical protein DVH24_002076 [Malus domestica]
MPLKFKRKFYRTTIRPSMLYDTECWAGKQQHVHKLRVKMGEERRRWGGEGRLGMEVLGEGWVGLEGGGEERMSVSGEGYGGGRPHPREMRERRERERVVEEVYRR